MANLFGLFNSAASSLMAQQISLEITGQNIANAYTEGYSRQRVDLEASVSIKFSQGFIGTGVSVSQIKRVHDETIEVQHNQALQERGKWEIESQFLQVIEKTFNETNEGELSTLIGDFFNEWYNVANNPEDFSMRSSLMASADLLTNRIGQIYDKVEDINDSIEDELAGIASELHNMGREIADINFQIQSTETSTQQSNDLRDKRDKLISDLSNLVDLKALKQSNGSFNIIIGGSFLLVSGADSANVEFQMDRTDPANPVPRMVLGNMDILPSLLEGKAGGLVEVKDKIIPGILSELDNLSASLVTEVNAVHAQGYGMNGNTGSNFFEPFTSPIVGSNKGSAKAFRISQEVLSDPRSIAVGKISAPGDNTNAIEIAELQNKMINFTVERAQTFIGYYSETVSSLGASSRKAINGFEQSDIMEKQINTFKQSISGVSLDEELANMILFQRAYQSSAKFISVVDSMMDTLINRMGA